MGISGWESLGYIFQGAAEGSEEIRKEKLAARMEQMKDDKTLYRDIAKTRYATDLATFQDESKKYKKVSAVLANIKKNNINRDQAAIDLINANDKLFTAYLATDEKDKGDFIANIQSSYFKDEDNGGFSVSYPMLGVTAPQESDYFKGADFWKKYAEEIESGTKGPLSEQVRKLLHMKKADAGDQVKLDMNVRGTEIYGDMDSKSYASTNTTPSTFGLGTDYYAYDLDDVTEKTRFDDIIKKFEDISSRTNKEATVARHIVALGGDAKDISFDDKHGVLTLSSDGANNFTQATNMYDSISAKIRGAIVKPGTVISKKDEYASQNVVNSVFNEAINNRTIRLKNEKIFGGGTIDSNWIIGEVHPEANLRIGLDDNEKLHAQFLNGDPALLQRIEDAVNNHPDFIKAKGDAGTAKYLIDGIIANEIEAMVQEGVLGETKDDKKSDDKEDDKKNGDEKPKEFSQELQDTLNGETGIQYVKDTITKNLLTNPDANVEAFIAKLEESGYEVSEEIKKVAPATAIPDRYIRKGAAKSDNPEWALWVESGLPRWQTAIEYIESVKPKKRGSKIEGKGPSSEWSVWNRKFNYYIDEWNRIQPFLTNQQ